MEEEVDAEKERVSWKQVENSALRLDKLSSDGSELVSNVRVAEDAREVQCRQQQEEARNARSQSISNTIVHFGMFLPNFSCVVDLKIRYRGLHTH